MLVAGGDSLKAVNNPLVRALLMLAVLGFAAGASLADPPTIAVARRGDTS
jgi:hypothetical protein